MKIFKKFKTLSGFSKNVLTMLGIWGFSAMAFADPASDDTFSNLTDFQGDIAGNLGTIFHIIIVVATMAGLILIIKGLVHLKQNYTGTGQEKHLSKGIASLGFGTALILAVPITHALVGSFDSGATASYQTGTSAVNFAGS